MPRPRVVGAAGIPFSNPCGPGLLDRPKAGPPSKRSDAWGRFGPFRLESELSASSRTTGVAGWEVPASAGCRPPAREHDRHERTSGPGRAGPPDGRVIWCPWRASSTLQQRSVLDSVSRGRVGPALSSLVPAALRSGPEHDQGLLTRHWHARSGWPSRHDGRVPGAEPGRTASRGPEVGRLWPKAPLVAARGSCRSRSGKGIRRGGRPWWHP